LSDHQISADVNHCTVFASWLTQWKMTVLPAASAQQVMQYMLDGHAHYDCRHTFWITITNYLCDHDRGISGSPRGTMDSMAELQEQVRKLTPAEARKLLLCVAAIHSSSLDRSDFWRIAGEAVSMHERACDNANTPQQPLQ
jgi:hypothetical protein